MEGEKKITVHSSSIFRSFSHSPRVQSFSVKKKNIALVCFVPLNTVIKNLICIAGKAGNFHVLSVVKLSNFMVCDRLIEKLF